MNPRIIKAKSLHEFDTPEGCQITENWASQNVSIAKAKVKPGITTVPHHLEDVDEIYVIVKGKGKVKIGNLKPAIVKSGDTVFIPANASQQITNTGRTDLVFYCICTPRFTQECYHSES